MELVSQRNEAVHALADLILAHLDLNARPSAVSKLADDVRLKPLVIAVKSGICIR